MRTNRRELEARRNAARLRAAVETAHPDFAYFVSVHGPRATAEQLLGITVSVAETVASDCGVAGSSDVVRRKITVARANDARMRFTTLHEVGHVEGARDIAFQEALETSALTRNAVERNLAEEDACEQFAADLLVPQVMVDEVVSAEATTAAGLQTLYQKVDASLEACAVAWAHALEAPGYVAIFASDGTLQFAARSGDVLPLRRGCDQRDTELWRRAASSRWRGRARFAFDGGSLTDEFEVDALSTAPGLIVVAVADSPAWVTPYRPPTKTRVADAWLDGYCDSCGVEFQATQRCKECGDPTHPACGHCSCEPAPVAGERTCTACWLKLPAKSFPKDSLVCEGCL